MKIFLVSHGKLADGMKNSIEMISGKHTNLQSFSMSEGDSPDILGERVKKEINKYNNEPILLISDFPGGSINTTLTKFINDHVFLISGMNIMMVLELILNKSNSNVQELINAGIKAAQKSIVVINYIKEDSETELGDDFFD
ncbi:PTS sugar transporter subunit IIA [Xylocopilactobacillus apis]|uniref:PTS mannose transporter subunit IIA n=1 Tax=Xylocopilactobacillus apis TaxID=2932183 RepID=A0AAU9D3R7_9LACO|nr:hypothetical protein [Xylocopilactobacillus apis]BDR56975.1 PTS mannose transporter subunit IIA [Xylocopilactobacillus apis]